MKWFSAFGAPVESAPEPSPAPRRAPKAPPPSKYALPEPEARSVAPTAFRPLAPQIAKAMEPLKDKHGVAKMAEAMEVTTNTVRSAMSGIGMRLSTLEAVCEVAGWTVTITDDQGKTIIQS